MDFDFSFDDIFKEKEPKPEKKVKVSHRYGHRHLTRKVTSEQSLLSEMPWHYKDGDCYHCFSWGDVDSLTYFKHVLRQQHVKYLALSTWCMAGEDVDDLRNWYERGFIDRVDFFVGEIFPGSYSEVYEAVKQFADIENGRVVVFRNHSKVMAVVGDKYDCLIESSANVNTNPRSENTVITVDSTLVHEYIDIFNGITPFNKDYPDRPGYEWNDGR